MRRKIGSLELMSSVNMTEHPRFEELLTFPRPVLSSLDVDERLAEPAHELVSGEGFRPIERERERERERKDLVSVEEMVDKM